MRPRALLIALIALASASFVIGVALERSGETGHHEARAESTTQHRERPASGEQGESEAAHAAETAGATPSATADADAGNELRPLGSTSRCGRS